MHFKNRLIFLTGANPKGVIVMNNAYSGLNLPKVFKSNVVQIKNSDLRCM